MTPRRSAAVRVRLDEDTQAQLGALCGTTGAVRATVSLEGDTAIIETSEGDPALQLAKQTLEQRNHELDQLVYLTSHDLQEPLRTVSSLVDIYTEEFGHLESDEAAHLLQRVQAAVARMSAKIHALMTHSRIGRSDERVSRIDGDQIVALAISELSTVLERSQAQVEVAPLPEVYGKAEDLQLLFVHLLTNALKFSDPDRPPRIAIDAERQGDRWVFSVRDNGIGIETGHQQRIFDVFARLHGRNEYPGVGIGLAHCEKIVQQHGGRIWVESTPGQGSRFRFTLKAP